VSVGRAVPADRDAILALVRACDLPLDGLREHLDTAIVARLGAAIVGCAALEPYENGALLRSVSVAASARGLGIGQAITQAALDLAAELDAPAVFLLTTTAEGFFPRFGFEVIQRAEVPASVQQSIEFRSACPASATVMRVRRPK
jgi:amino-acid N-acetyltransferase